MKKKTFFRQSFIKLLTSTSIFLAINGMLVTVFSSQLYKIEIKPEILLTAFLITFSIYNLNKATDKTEDSINKPEISSRKTLYYLGPAIISLIFSLWMGLSKGASFVMLLMIPIIVGVLYSVKLSKSTPRIKEIVGAKSSLVAFCWALIGSLLPAFGQRVELEIIILNFSFIFIQISVNTIIFDSLDIEGDKYAGLNTIPIVLGKNKTVKLLTITNSLLIPLIIICVLVGVPLKFILTITFGMIYGYLIIWAFPHKSFRRLTVELTVDGEWIPFITFMEIAVQLI